MLKVDVNNFSIINEKNDILYFDDSELEQYFKI